MNNKLNRINKIKKKDFIHTLCKTDWDNQLKILIYNKIKKKHAKLYKIKLFIINLKEMSKKIVSLNMEK